MLIGAEGRYTSHKGDEVSKNHWLKIRQGWLRKEELKDRLTRTLGEVSKMPTLFDKGKLVSGKPETRRR